MLYIAPSDVHGVGVFTDCMLYAGGVFEQAPILVLEPGDLDAVRKTRLGNTLYQYGDGQAGMLLSPMALVNHSRSPNVRYEKGEGVILFSALWNIKEGAELLIDYADFAKVLGID